MAVMAASALSAPHPDEYKIPAVGNNQRSQYYVLHDDGSFKYGYDTGDDAFESQKTSSSGDVDGKYGYRDADGQEVRVQYTSGQGGFVARGDHIPQVHPDVASAFAEARARPSKNYVDPLAGTGGDKSYNFNFAGDEHSRNEVSDDDGTVRGSYSYIDEFGRTRSYTYRAGKGIGFVIEGDDLPQPVQPLPSHTVSTTQFGAPHSTRAQAPRSPTRKTSSQTSVSSGHSAHAGQRVTTQRKLAKPTQTYFAPSASAASSGAAVTKTSSVTQHSSFASQPTATHANTRTPVRTRPFEAANTRLSQSPTGSYSLAYDTSSHSRQEQGDDNNNVRGKFTFKADDDGVDRSVSYEASSATGFVASGAHLPIGPIVPGAPTGQVTGRIVPVVEVPFVDPLAGTGLDASYNFGFDSDTYSRSETADEDGNVSGTYSVLGEDGILRTYRFRAGKGIGFETEEVSAVASQRRSQATASVTHQQTSTFSHGSPSAGTSVAARPSVSRTPIAPHQSSPHSSRSSAQQSAFSSSVSSGSSSSSKFGSSSGSRASFKSKGSDEVFPGFTLRQYDASEGRGKYGYVLRFDD